MGAPLSIRRRRQSFQTLRLSQPSPFCDGLGQVALGFYNTGASVQSSTTTAHTPGAWVQIFSNTAVASTDTIHQILIQGIGNNQAASTDNSMLVDIGTGASGSEVVVAPDIAIGGLQNAGGFGPSIHLPIRIPGATRIAFRVRAAVTSRIFVPQQVIVTGAPTVAAFADRLPTSVDTLGTSQSTSAGTAMSGSSGSWTLITASTTKDYQALIIVPSGPASAGTGLTATQWRLDLGIGPSGSEVPVAFHQGSYVSTAFVAPFSIAASSAVYGGFVPAGTRISVRHNMAANPERVCACVIGVPYV